MVWGIAILFRAEHLLILLACHLFLTHLFDRFYISSLIETAWLRFLIGLGFLSFTLLLGAIWTYYLGHGIIYDLELFNY